MGGDCLDAGAACGLIIPIVLVGKDLVEGLQPLIAHARAGNIAVPAPPAGVEKWPLIGGPLFRAWNGASTDLSATLMKFSPQIKSALPNILSASADVGSTLLQFLLSIAVSGAILANAKAAAAAAGALMIRLFGEHRGQSISNWWAQRFAASRSGFSAWR